MDVVKYKLDKMRQKIENKERDSTCKTLFKCPKCLKEFNEFDAGNLMDMMTGLMHCTFCGAEVLACRPSNQERHLHMTFIRPYFSYPSFVSIFFYVD